eukprot:1734728-Rhodomonas_salina.1
MVMTTLSCDKQPRSRLVLVSGSALSPDTSSCCRRRHCSASLPRESRFRFGQKCIYKDTTSAASFGLLCVLLALAVQDSPDTAVVLRAVSARRAAHGRECRYPLFDKA